MSEFSAPGISSGINFDISSMISGIGKAIEEATRFESAVHSKIDAPMEHAGLGAHAMAGEFAIGEIAVELLKKALEAVAEAFKFVAESVVEATKFVAEMVNETAEASLAMGLLAEKSGVSVEFLDKWAAAGKHVNVGAETIAQGFKFLQRNVDEVQDGNKQAEKSFRDLGISMSFVKSHKDDMGAMFEKIHEQLAKIPDQAERTHKAIDVFGRGGGELTPLLNLPLDKIEAYAAEVERAGAGVDASAVRQGKAWKDIKISVDTAWEGIRRQVSKPILGLMIDEWPKLKPVIDAATTAVLSHLPSQQQLQHALAVTIEKLGIATATAIDLAPPFINFALDAADAYVLLAHAVTTSANAIAYLADKGTAGLTPLHGITETLSGLDDALAQVHGATRQLRSGVNQASFTNAANDVITGTANAVNAINAPITIKTGATPDEIARATGKEVHKRTKQHLDNAVELINRRVTQQSLKQSLHAGVIK